MICFHFLYVMKAYMKTLVKGLFVEPLAGLVPVHTLMPYLADQFMLWLNYDEDSPSLECNLQN